ncbi:dephospho-CoA kinase [Gammaproteobacteria bacterium AB-CW1]|uniref:Dephospho-CoA kinase n=1 Tax=Natronospira elongata TaxID=3110268 RepID=A0AAP6JD81_9GAMM|nr:dephospho-CoA kinase [Gammaproteobacteria bacterium AB-CW1]
MATNGQKQPPLWIALTGGAGSGKSAVADHLRSLGVTVVDTDQLAREVVAPGEAGLAAVVAAFGDQLLTADGELDRRRLREQILADDNTRHRLESILHPLIMERLTRQLAQAEGPYAVAEIPLLVESGQQEHFDRVITVEAPMAERIQRLMQRDQVDESAARRLIAAQADESARRAIADQVIENDQDLAALKERVEALHQELLSSRL